MPIRSDHCRSAVIADGERRKVGGRTRCRDDDDELTVFGCFGIAGHVSVVEGRAGLQLKRRRTRLCHTYQLKGFIHPTTPTSGSCRFTTGYTGELQWLITVQCSAGSRFSHGCHFTCTIQTSLITVRSKDTHCGSIVSCIVFLPS